MVEATGGFTRQFHVAGLVFSHGDMARFVNQDIGSLQQRVAQKTVGGQVFVFEIFLLVFVGGYTLEPANGRAHGQQSEQLGMLRNTAL